MTDSSPTTEEYCRGHYTEDAPLLFLFIEVITSMIYFRVVRREWGLRNTRRHRSQSYSIEPSKDQSNYSEHEL